MFFLRESPCGRGCLRNVGVEGGRETNPIFVFLFFSFIRVSPEIAILHGTARNELAVKTTNSQD